MSGREVHNSLSRTAASAAERASAAAAAVLTAPEGWQNILFSTLGNKLVQVTYMGPLYASYARNGLDDLKLKANQSFLRPHHKASGGATSVLCQSHAHVRLKHCTEQN